MDNPDLGGRHLNPLAVGGGAIAGHEGDDYRSKIETEEKRHGPGPHEQEDRRRGRIDGGEHADENDETLLGEGSVRRDHRVHEQGAIHSAAK